MRDIDAVLKAGMCTGCGLCARAESDMKIDKAGYLRPIEPIRQLAIDQACPGRQVAHHNSEAPYDVTWGPILSSQTGHATDPEVRRRGSSGGVISALLLHLLNNRKVDAVIQVGISSHDPIRNSTYIHEDPSAVLANAGSRYAPSSPLAVVHSVLGNGKTYAFVGKPCDVAALRALLQNQSQYRKQFPFMLSFMCAGVPSEHGTESILKKMGVTREELSTFRYRGDGWPGLTQAVTLTGQTAALTYNETWGTILNRHLQARCKVCADGIGEAADVVCADAWHEAENGYPSFEERDGRSLILARTRAGQQLIDDARATADIRTNDYFVGELNAIQPYQANRKHTALARRIALFLAFSGAPVFHGYSLMRAAMLGGVRTNFLAMLGTLRRKLRKRL